MFQLDFFGEEIKQKEKRKQHREARFTKSPKRGKYSGKSQTPFGSYEER
jgi:hypothetical protein